MTDPTGPLKPQDTIIFLMGEMKGELRAIREGQAAAAVSHAASDAANLKEHEEFRAAISSHTSDLNVLKDARAESRRNGQSTIQRWTTRLTIPAVLIGSITSYLLSKYTP